MTKRMAGVLVFLLGMLWGSSAFATASATISVGSAGNVFLFGPSPLSLSTTGWGFTIHSRAFLSPLDRRSSPFPTR
jgi:hypothetical protein